MSGALRARTLGADQRADAEAIWTALERGGEVPLACSWLWTGTWLRHYGDAVPHRFIVGEDESGARGIVLVTEQAGAGRLRPRTIHLGTAGEPPGATVFVERNALLAAPGAEAGFAATVMEALAEDRRWERLELDGMLPAAADALLAGDARGRRHEEASPVADLTAAPDGDVVAALPASRRQRIRRTLRQLGPLECEWAATPEAAHAVLDELIELHEHRWGAEGVVTAFRSSRFTGFHRELVDRLVPADGAALFRVRRAGETIGCLYGLVDGTRMLFYQGGIRRLEDNRLRAGVAAHVLFMQACRERGLEAYDFLSPAARYKQELSTREERLVWATIERPALRVRLQRAVRRTRGWRRR